MTREETISTLQSKLTNCGNYPPTVVVRYPCPGGYAVLAPVLDDQQQPYPDLWHILTAYHVNIFEELYAIAAVPLVVRIPAADVAASTVDVPEPAWPTP